MGQYTNALYAGQERMRGEERLMMIEGNMIKHPSLISTYGVAAQAKRQEKPLPLIGIDIETDHITGQPFLLGVWRNEKYRSFYAGQTSLFNALYNLLWTAKGDKKRGIEPAALACWRKFDGYALLRILLEYGRFSDEETKQICERLDKIEGKHDPKKQLEWIVKPPILIEFKQGMKRIQIGVKRAIRSSIEFFIWNAGYKAPFTVWLYDVSTFYNRGLEKEASERYDWYSKVDTTAHTVDWSRFDSDTHYRNNIVLRSNELDARAAAALGVNIQEAFYSLLGVYPRTLISTGGLARLAARTFLENASDSDGYASLSIYAQLRDWKGRGIDESTMKRAYHLAVAAYSGGLIEALQLGSAKRGAVADISSAYPSVIVNLRDLRGSTITSGSGVPPAQTTTRYVFIEGTVHVPSDPTIIHTITIRDDVKKQVNQRPQGIFRATYTEHERAFAAAQGVTFKDEEWIAIQCEDRLSPLASVNQQLVKLRADLKARGDSGEYAAKIAANSQYGITYEGVPLFNEDASGGMLHDGYRAGELFNPIIAGLITSETRIKLATAALEIQRRGGIPIILMTDSVVWTAPETVSDDELLAMLPGDLWRPTKILGYFEQPEIVRDILCIAPGRYEYIKGNKLTMKTLGFTVERAAPTNEFSADEVVGKSEVTDTAKQGHYRKSWREMLQAANPDATEITVQTRRLVSPGMLAMGQATRANLCLVMDVIESVSLEPQWLKRDVRGVVTAGRLLSGLTPTFKPNAQFSGGIPDGTLAKLWKAIEARPVFETDEQKERRQERNRKKDRKRRLKRKERVQRHAGIETLLTLRQQWYARDRVPWGRQQQQQQLAQQMQTEQQQKDEQHRAQNASRQKRLRIRQAAQLAQLTEEQRQEALQQKRQYEAEKKRRQRQQKKAAEQIQ